MENNYEELSVPTTFLAAIELRFAFNKKEEAREREREGDKKDRGKVKEPKTLKAKLARGKESELRVVSLR